MTIGFILLVLALAELVIGIRFLFRYQRSTTSVFYGFFCFSVALYVGANAIGFLHVANGNTAERLGWAGGAIATAFFLPFTYVFPLPQRTGRELFPWAFWPVLLFGFGMLFSDVFIQTPGVINYGQGYQTTTGSYFWVFLIFFGFYWLWSLVNLARSYQHSDGIHRIQIRVIIVGIVFSLIAASIFDIILPLITPSPFGYVGSLLTSAWLGATTYILLKK